MAIETNMIFSGETIRIVSALTDINDNPVAFADLISSTVVVTDNLGNSVSPTIAVDPNDANALTYTVDTTNLRQGEITGVITLEFNSPNFPTVARDIVRQLLFEIEGKKSDGEGLTKSRPIKIGDEIGAPPPPVQGVFDSTFDTTFA